MLALPDEKLASLGIQDVALCQVWWVNGGACADPPPGFAGLQSRVQRWLALSDRPVSKSAGRRSQTLLRELIDRLEADQVDKMQRDELDLLEAVHGLAQSVENPEVFERVRRAIAPRRARIAARRAGLPPAVGTPTLTARFLVVRACDIQCAPPREVRVIAGVEAPSRGPVMVHCGHVRVLDEVPEGSTLVVEEGACVVDGYVLGRVAVSGSCEILENVSGFVISRNGDVRARNIVDSAFVVAKRGSVYCKRVAGARLVFAGSRIHVDDRASRSRLLAPEVIVTGCIEAGEVHASRRITSDSFRSAADSPLALVFRRSLSCKDYGEDPGKKMSVEVTHALRVRADLERLRQRIRIAIAEAESAAESVLTFALAGDAVARVAGEVVAAQRRLDVINRVLLGLRALYASAESAVEAGDAAESDVDETFLDELDGELRQIMTEHPSDAEMHASYNEVVQSRQQLKRSGGNRKLTRAALSDVSLKLARWRDEFVKLDQEVREGRAKIRTLVQSSDLVQDPGAARSRVLALQRVVQRAEARGVDDPLRKRFDAPFATVLMRTIEKRLALSRKLKEDTERVQKEFDLSRDAVWTRFQMRIDTGDPAEARIVVEGRFETTVRLASDPAFLTATPEDIPGGGVCIAVSTGNRIARYVSVGGHITEESVETSAAPALAAV